MSEKKRLKKDGSDKGKEYRAMREAENNPGIKQSESAHNEAGKTAKGSRDVKHKEG